MDKTPPVAEAKVAGQTLKVAKKKKSVKKVVKKMSAKKTARKKVRG